jgi:hypothetical protein
MATLDLGEWHDRDPRNNSALSNWPPVCAKSLHISFYGCIVIVGRKDAEYIQLFKLVAFRRRNGEMNTSVVVLSSGVEWTQEETSWVETVFKSR